MQIPTTTTVYLTTKQLLSFDFAQERQPQTLSHLDITLRILLANATLGYQPAATSFTLPCDMRHAIYALRVLRLDWCRWQPQAEMVYHPINIACAIFPSSNQPSPGR